MTRTKRPSAATPAPAGDPAGQRRSELLAAAYALIAEKGLEGLRTRDIAARAGLNISTLHYYFGTKEALVEAVVQFVSDKFASTARDERAETTTLREHFERAWLTFQRHPQLAIVLQELALRAQRDPATRVAFRALFKHWNLEVAAVVAREKRNGSLRADVPPAGAALIVTSFIMGAMTQLGVSGQAVDFKALSRELERLLTTVALARPRP
jgi:AcrR family transcriptional regulator